MNYTDKKLNTSKIYSITGTTALVYSGILIIFSIYSQFFYIDETWFHGFTSNGFSVLSNLIWAGILFIFKLFLNKTLNYKRVNTLINTYLIFLGITIFSVSSVLIKSIKIYSSLENTESANSLLAFASTSIMGAIFLFLANFAIIIICILLGNRIRKIDFIEDKLLKALDFSFIVYGTLSILSTLTIIENNMIQYLVKAVLAVLTALILKKTYNVNLKNLHSSSTEFESNVNLIQTETKPQDEYITQKTSTTIEKTNIQTEKPIIKRKKEINIEQNKAQEINLDELADKEMILSYFENLPKEEINRLEIIISKDYNQNLTDDQKRNLIIQYIVKNKLYDHQRFFPK